MRPTRTCADIRRTVIRAASVLLFSGILLLSYQKITWVLQKKLPDDKIHMLYEQPKDSLDVVFVGSSHVHYGISPMQLWNKFGFASFDASSPSQSVPVSYYVTKEAVRTQHPKVIVLDVYYLFINLYARGQGHLHEVSDAMPMFAKNRIEMINDLAPKAEGEERVWSFYFPIAYAHSRWKELQKIDFHPKAPYMKGQMVSARTAEVELFTPKQKEYVFPEAIMAYLEKIKAFCKENDTELLLICIPYSQEREDVSRMRKQLAMMKQLNTIAQENGYAYLNLYDRMEEIGIDTASDFCSAHHLNVYGAEKLTAYLGEYLKANYDLPDHRNEVKYASWNNDYERYLKRIETVINDISESD